MLLNLCPESPSTNLAGMGKPSSYQGDNSLFCEFSTSENCSRDLVVSVIVWEKDAGHSGWGLQAGLDCYLFSSLEGISPCSMLLSPHGADTSQLQLSAWGFQTKFWDKKGSIWGPEPLPIVKHLWNLVSNCLTHSTDIEHEIWRSWKTWSND